MRTRVKVRGPITYVEIDTNDWTPAFSKIEKNTTIQKASQIGNQTYVRPVVSN
jgi:hypothetical protein